MGWNDCTLTLVLWVKHRANQMRIATEQIRATAADAFHLTYSRGNETLPVTCVICERLRDSCTGQRP